MNFFFFTSPAPSTPLWNTTSLNPCALVCAPEKMNWLVVKFSRVVVDGTSCGPSSICTAGKCIVSWLPAMHQSVYAWTLYLALHWHSIFFILDPFPLPTSPHTKECSKSSQPYREMDGPEAWNVHTISHNRFEDQHIWHIVSEVSVTLHGLAKNFTTLIMCMNTHTHIYIYIYIIILIIIIIMSCRQHGYPWPSLATPPYRSSLLAGLQGYIPW